MAQAAAYATYLVELAMLDYSMLGHTYSMVAAGAVVCANRLLGREDDCPHALQKHCGYNADQLLPCARELAHLHSKSGPSRSSASSHILLVDLRVLLHACPQLTAQ